MEIFQRVAIAVILIGPLAVVGAVYTGLVWDGKIAPPDLQALAQSIIPVATGGLALAIGLTVAVIVVCAAVAPVIYAVRSGDVLTVLVSLVLTTAAIALFFTAKSAIHEILAVLVYLANTVLSTMVYAAHRIARHRQG
jgi:hypothetical protein